MVQALSYLLLPPVVVGGCIVCKDQETEEYVRACFELTGNWKGRVLGIPLLLSSWRWWMGEQNGLATRTKCRKLKRTGNNKSLYSSTLMN